ncbi:MAG: DUF4145 domain-containing protein [Gammaproteobacteria bacterium]|nr:DUF4145 domain-containing protein [Gammaproteobacteria bacterium]
MNITRKYALKTEPETSKSICNKCLNKTNHKVVSNFTESGSEDCGHGNSVDWHEEYQIIQCCGCEEISFKKIMTNSEDVDFDGHHINYVTYYPQRSLSQPYLSIEFLPLKIHRIYKETISALNNEQRILASIGIRTLIEAVCSEVEAEGKTLYKKITDLKNKSIVTIEGETALHKLRILGNTSAHEAKPPSMEKLLTALKVVEHMLDGTYIIPDKIRDTFPDEKPKD